MKNNVKKIFMGVCTVGLCCLVALSTYGAIVSYAESFKAVGIIAILMFIYTTVGLAMLLCAYQIIGDAIMYVREKNMKKNEERSN